MGTPLLHDLFTTPTPLPTAGTGALCLYVKNNDTAPHALDWLTITLPTDVWAGGEIHFKAPDGWSGAPSPEGGGVTFKPASPTQLAHGETLAFTLGDIQLQSSPTIGRVSFAESVDGAEYDDQYGRLGVYVILGDVPASDMKFSGPSAIERGESGFLTWAGPDHATYTLDPGDVTLSSRSGTWPIAPHSTTTYTLTVVYVDPETGDTHTATPQWTVKVNVPGAELRHFDAWPLSLDPRADGSYLLRLHCTVDIESAVRAEIVQVGGVNPDPTKNTSILWSKSASEEGGINGRYTLDLDVPVYAYNDLTFRLIVSSDPDSGAGDVSSGDVTFAVPAPRILAFTAPQFHGGRFPMLLVAAQWSTGNAFSAPSGDSLPALHGVFVLDTTPADREGYLAGAPRQTASGQLATVDGPFLQLHGLDEDEYDLRAQASDDLTSLNTVNRLFHYLDTGDVPRDNPDGNDLRNGLIYNLSVRGGWSSESPGTLQGMGNPALVDRWLVTAFLRRVGHTQRDLGAMSCDAQRQALCDWCAGFTRVSDASDEANKAAAQAHATIQAWPDFARVERRAQVGTAIALWEMNNPPFVAMKHHADVMAPLVALLTPECPRWAVWKLLCPLLCRIKAKGGADSDVLVTVAPPPESVVSTMPWNDGDVTQLWSVVVADAGSPRHVRLLHASTGLFLTLDTAYRQPGRCDLTPSAGTYFAENPDGDWVTLTDTNYRPLLTADWSYFNLANNDFDPPWSPPT